MAQVPERLHEFVRRLRLAPAARSFDEAYGQIFRILNEVEDEMSKVPYDLSKSRNDGRLYPPLWDYMSKSETGSNVTRLRSVGHITYISSDGAITIVDVRRRATLISKAGENGVRISGHDES